MKRFSILVLIVLSMAAVSFSQSKEEREKKVIYLSMEEVIGQSLDNNLSLKSKRLDYESQNLEVWNSYSSFLPSLTYQGSAVKNVELPVFVFMGEAFTMGTPYTYEHTFTLSLPIFTGGSRLFNLSAQKSLKRSLSEELKGKESETVLEGLENYYGIILAQSLFETSREAVTVAKENLEQVQKQYDAGTGTELDLQRAKAQYFGTLPTFESARANLKLAQQQLKSYLDMPLNDSLVVVDSLAKNEFLGEFAVDDLDQLKKSGFANRHELLAMRHQLDATEEGEKIALSSFAPTIAMSASLDHQAQLENYDVAWSDYVRSKSIALSVSWPIFEGGSKVINYQKAKIKTDQMKITLKQFEDQTELNVEQNYYEYIKAQKNLSSLKEALKQSKESLRISNLLYEQGMSTQLDVLNAQLLYINSKTDYQQGIYDYNISQLSLLNSIGKLNTIWN